MKEESPGFSRGECQNYPDRDEMDECGVGVKPKRRVRDEDYPELEQ